MLIKTLSDAIEKILDTKAVEYQKLRALKELLYSKEIKEILDELAAQLVFTPMVVEPILKANFNYKQSGETVGFMVEILDALKLPIANLFKSNSMISHLSSAEIIFMKNAVSAVLKDDFELALDEILALQEEVPVNYLVGYSVLAQTICAKTEYSQGWLFFKKLHVQALFENAQFDEANEALKDLEGLLDSEELKEFENMLDSDMEKMTVLISCGKSLEGFRLAVEIYHKSGVAEKKDLLKTLEEVFALPNQDRLVKNYKKNAKALLNYPYWIGDKIPENPDIIVFPVSETESFVYDKQADDFYEIEVRSKRETKYFFGDLSRPLLVENEANAFNLQFLVDNVRASEYVAKDNHIYLYYENPQIFYALLQSTDFFHKEKTDKFVFLIGDRSRYPLDFLDEYGIDYAKMPTRDIDVGEIKRMIYNRTIVACSGCSLFASITDGHPNLLTNPSKSLEKFHHVYFGVIKKSNDNKLIDNFSKLPEDNLFRIEIETLLSKANHTKEEKDKRIPRYLNILKKIKNPSDNSFSGWINAIILSYSILENKVDPSERIVPTVVVYQHFPGIRELEAVARALSNEIKYFQIVTMIRDPLSSTSSLTKIFIDAKKFGASNVTIREAWLGYAFQEYFHFSYPDNVLYEKGVIVRFEDLKLNLVSMLTALVRHFNIPYDEALTLPTQNGVKAATYSSFSERDTLSKAQLSFHLENHDTFGEFDKYRIEMIVHKYYETFGYKPKFYDGRSYSLQQATQLFSEPFVCDKTDLELEHFTKEQLQQRIMAIMPHWLAFYKNPVPPNKDLLPIKMLQPITELLEEELYE